jgi:hypothetical protein
VRISLSLGCTPPKPREQANERWETNHDDRRKQPQCLLHHRLGVRHLLDHLQRNGRVDIVAPNPVLLFSDLGKDVRVVGEELKRVDDGGGHGILGGEEEREDDHGDFVVGELSDEDFSVFLVWDLGSDSGVDLGWEEGGECAEERGSASTPRSFVFRSPAREK